MLTTANSRNDSRFVQKEPCPACGSKDNLARYSDGHAYCFSTGCEHYEGPNGGEVVPMDIERKPTRALEMNGVVAAIPDRKISKKICAKYGVTVEFAPSGDISKHHYPRYDQSDNLVGSKVRIVETKGFYATGETQKLKLVGQSQCRVGGKYLTVVEGELDMLSVAEMFEGRWDVVSLNNGAKGAEEDIRTNLEFIESYEKVVFCLDMDKDGDWSWDKVKDIIEPGKAAKAKLPLKDPNALLVANRIKDFMASWWAAEVYRPDGIVNGKDTWDAIVARREVKSVPYPYEGLNKMTRGIRGGEVVLITSGTGMGKSQFVRELEHYLLGATKENIGVLALEESTEVTAMGIMSIEANRRLHLEEDTDTVELKPYFDATMGTGRFFLFDHFGSTTQDNIINRIRFMIKGCKCSKILLDHLSIVVSDQEGGDERKVIDAIMTKLRTIAEETGATIFVVCHLKRPEGKNHEEGARVTLGHLRGSGAIAQLSDIVIAFERDQQAEDPEKRNISTVRVLKNRFTGETGVASYLHYDHFTGRMAEGPGFEGAEETL